jgi:hypothetical protein
MHNPLPHSMDSSCRSCGHTHTHTLKTSFFLRQLLCSWNPPSYPYRDTWKQKTKNFRNWKQSTTFKQKNRKLNSKTTQREKNNVGIYSCLVYTYIDVRFRLWFPRSAHILKSSGIKEKSSKRSVFQSHLCASGDPDSGRFSTFAITHCECGMIMGKGRLRLEGVFLKNLNTCWLASRSGRKFRPVLLATQFTHYWCGMMWHACWPDKRHPIVHI